MNFKCDPSFVLSLIAEGIQKENVVLKSVTLRSEPHQTYLAKIVAEVECFLFEGDHLEISEVHKLLETRGEPINRFPLLSIDLHLLEKYLSEGGNIKWLKNQLQEKLEQLVTQKGEIEQPSEEKI